MAVFHVEQEGQTMLKNQIVLGARYRDKVTGLEGVAIGITTWLTGCDSVGLLGPAQDGKVAEPYWTDTSRVEPIGDGASVMETKAVETVVRPGGPQPTPKAVW